MEKANKKIIIIALALSLLTAVLVYIYMSGTKTVVSDIEYATVYVAAKTMPARYEITAADIKQVKIAKELVNTRAVTDMEDIKGKRLIESIIEGEQIIKERLADENNMLLSFSIPEGTRAVSMNVNEQVDVAYLLRPGDFVDIMASFEKEEENNDQIAKSYPKTTKTILQNVQVLALGQNMKLSPDKLAELPLTVTLAIKTAEVDKFVYASDFGILRLALRHVDDKAENTSPDVLREDVTGTKGVFTVQTDNELGAAGN